MASVALFTPRGLDAYEVLRNQMIKNAFMPFTRRLDGGTRITVEAGGGEAVVDQTHDGHGISRTHTSTVFVYSVRYFRLLVSLVGFAASSITLVVLAGLQLYWEVPS